MEQYEAVESSRTKDQIRVDLGRTMAGHHTAINCDEGLESLERVLGAVSMYNPRIGYCQSMNFIAAHLLCNLREEDAFWLLLEIVHSLVPEYYGPAMDGLQAHAALLERVAGQLMPVVLERFNEAQVGAPNLLLSAAEQLVHTTACG